MTHANATGEQRLNELIANDPQLAFLPRMFDRFPGAEWYVVGGAVRDALLGRAGRKDYDLVARGVSLEALSEALEKEGAVSFVGKSFGVLKFIPRGFEAEEAVDIAWPRTERAGGSGGYRDFEVSADPSLTIERDLERRDFTVNAIAWNVRERRLVDPTGGVPDLERRVIRAVGKPAERFAEDYSRMLRALRFACQLGFEIEKKTWSALAERMPHLDDARGENERVVPYETASREFVKALAADRVKAIDLFEKSGALFLLLPELAALSGCAQSPGQHSEGDVWTHTKLAITKLGGPEFAALFPDETPTVETTIAVLLHDVAKPLTAAQGPDHITFYGHAEQGSLLAKRAAEQLRLSSVEGANIDADRLGALIKNHLFPNVVNLAEVRRVTLEKYFLADPLVGRELLHLACADAAASLRPNGTTDLSHLRALLGELRRLETKPGAGAPKPLLTGEEVMAALQLAPGKEVGEMLDLVREAQLRGEISTADDAKKFLRAIKK